MSNRNQFERIAWDECVVGQEVWTWHYGKREIVPFGKVTKIEDTPKKFSIEITEANGKVCPMMYTKEYGREETTLYIPMLEKEEEND